jgi:hypothetical protein
MNEPTFWRLGRALLLGTAITAGTSLIAVALPTPGLSVRIAEATVAQSTDKDKQDKNKQRDRDEQNADQDRVLNGQVLDINTLKDPPELIVGTVDGQAVVRVMKTDEIVRNGVRLGDYIEADGEKQSEQLFFADSLSVSEHFKGDDSGNSNDNKSKKKH